MEALQIFKRRLRWFLGQGWSASDFDVRYLDGVENPWGYEESYAHLARRSAILDALPHGQFEVGLEVGCAEGFITEELSRRVNSLVALDVSSRAIERARHLRGDLPNVEFRVHDIRAGFPVEQPDLVLFSDVLYYLSSREIQQVMHSCVCAMPPGGILVFANEWAPHYRNLTPPSVVNRLIRDSGAWSLREAVEIPGGTRQLTITSYARVDDAP